MPATHLNRGLCEHWPNGLELLDMQKKNKRLGNSSTPKTWLKPRIIFSASCFFLFVFLSLEQLHKISMNRVEQKHSTARTSWSLKKKKKNRNPFEAPNCKENFVNRCKQYLHLKSGQHQSISIPLSVFWPHGSQKEPSDCQMDGCDLLISDRVARVPLGLRLLFNNFFKWTNSATRN